LIIVSPQLGDPIAWSASDLAALIDEIVSTYSVDEDRIYVTGMSMGGFGAWSLILDDPDRFAAVAPIAGGGASWQACRAKNVAAWIFHGARDEVVPVEYSRVMARELKKCGGKVRYTEYPDLNHDSWTTTYDNPDLYDWLLEQRR
jgi:predicted peptidase